MRILSLLPSATEIVYLLNLEDSLVGVTHECDYPPAARSKPRVSSSRIPPEATPAEIDQLVSESATGGPPTISLDAALIGRLQPDIVLTQDLCSVCAVPAGHLQSALDSLAIEAEVLSLSPSSLDDVLDDILRLGRLAGVEERAAAATGRLRERLAAVAGAVAGRERTSVLALEWGDPPYNAGHWVPQMIELAGGEPLLCAKGFPSSRLSWEEIAAAEPQAVVFMPCGFELDEARVQARPLLCRPELERVPQFYAAAANSFYSRPGPRLVAGVEALAAVLHDGTGLVAAPGVLERLR